MADQFIPPLDPNLLQGIMQARSRQPGKEAGEALLLGLMKGLELGQRSKALKQEKQIAADKAAADADQANLDFGLKALGLAPEGTVFPKAIQEKAGLAPGTKTARKETKRQGVKITENFISALSGLKDPQAERFASALKPLLGQDIDESELSTLRIMATDKDSVGKDKLESALNVLSKDFQFGGKFSEEFAKALQDDPERAQAIITIAGAVGNKTLDSEEAQKALALLKEKGGEKGDGITRFLELFKESAMTAASPAGQAARLTKKAMGTPKEVVAKEKSKDKVLVRNKEGKQFKVPASQLELAKKEGYTVVE